MGLDQQYREGDESEEGDEERDPPPAGGDRRRTRNVPNPTRVTFSPFLSEAVIVSRVVLSVSMASLLVMPVLAASFSTNCSLFNPSTSHSGRGSQNSGSARPRPFRQRRWPFLLARNAPTPRRGPGRGVGPL